MAGGDSSDCHIVPTRGSNIFRLRVRLPSPEDGWSVLSSSTTVSGCKCMATYRPGHTNTQVRFSLFVWNCPVLEASANVSTHMVLLDKTGSPAPAIGTGESLGDVSIGVGGKFMFRAYYSLKAEIDDIKANCVVDTDNHFDVLCSIDIDWIPPPSSVKEDLLDLRHDLAIMLDKQEHTDVSFHVGGETFSAHRLVLAARSPVFNTELYGPMAESKMNSITIKDMEASTFKNMLHYMYHGSLSGVCSSMAQYQHLLVAADRYGIEGLKKICEDKLSGNCITVDSVVSMLELAEDHVCPKLKATCLDFLADGDNFKRVTISDEYIRLIQSFPNLLLEVRSRIKRSLEESTAMNPGAHKKTRLR